MQKYTIGLDYGTLSCRGVMVRCCDGKIAASAAKEYTHGVMEHILMENMPLPDNWSLQYPADYLEVLSFIIPRLLLESEVSSEAVIGIGVDFTSCTVLPIGADNKPLCEQPLFKNNRNAYCKLWKHHSAQKQAEHINRVLESQQLLQDFRFGGKISPELMAPKVMETLIEAPEIYNTASKFIEAGDWITSVLTNSDKRSCSMAGYKMWWNREEGYPDNEIFKLINPEFENFVSEKLSGEVCNIGEKAGSLSKVWAKRLGLNEGIAVAPAIIDSHAGFSGSGICKEGQMMMVLGTSSVMLALSRQPYSGNGIMGGVRGAIVPGYYALESGIASVGDLFLWYINNNVPADYKEEAKERHMNLYELLNSKAEMIRPGESGLLALEWWNGNKTPHVDSSLSGVIAGMTLSTKPEHIYRALIEATAFGTREIMELYESKGVRIDCIAASGGISIKNPFIMQVYADILNKEIFVSTCTQTAALGSAMYAALSAGSACGGFNTYNEAVSNMKQEKEILYKPNKKNIEKYRELYFLYKSFSDIIGTKEKNVIHRLKKLKLNGNE